MLLTEKGLLAKILTALHPVGCVFYTTNSSYNPNNSIGGTWTLLGSTTVGSTTVYAWNRTA